MLGQRLQQARNAAGLSLRDLADKAGVTAMAISKYERDQMKPSSDVLLRLAKALNVRVDYFFRSAQVELTQPDFRKHPKLAKKEEERIIADVREQLERWLELESVLPASWPKAFNPPARLPARVGRLDDIESIAECVREHWDLGANPLRDVVEEFELEGIKVIISRLSTDNHFDGLVAMANSNPVIVVAEEWPGDRQRFTLAHELGHLILKDRLDPALDEEKACNRFAGAFLVPKKEALRALGESRSWLEPQELFLLKQEWGLSMNGWLHRAQDLRIINSTVAGKLWGLFRARGWRDKEPDPQYPKETAHRFEQLVFRALAEDLIGESRAAELLGVDSTQLRARRRMEATDAADHH
ncbi:helix-turn-helix domain-containing protein [Sinimarinibacterium flocculans]|uniref:helix-turn-helix domain-containing protein n=1 Tax=Sinimarinibacterium flocculans TaxID=985250 RepID=UPI003516DE8E